MHAPRPTVAWLLALALIASQWVLLAHDARHLQPVDAHACQLCVHHAAQDLLAGSAAPLVVARAFADTPVPARSSDPDLGPPRHYRSRAPPAVLV